jgi:hypothetical protein
MNRDGALTIGRLAKAAGVNLETVRYYERRGLVPKPPRTPSGYRLYPVEAARRLRFISAIKSECDKLYRFTFPIGTVITGGAGDGSLIEYANQEMHQFFARGEGQRPDSKWKPEDILAALKTFGKRFFRETIGEYKGFEASLVPSFAMLVAVNYEKRSYLFRWEDRPRAPARAACAATPERPAGSASTRRSRARTRACTGPLVVRRIARKIVQHRRGGITIMLL